MYEHGILEAFDELIEVMEASMAVKEEADNEALASQMENPQTLTAQNLGIKTW
jgi:hypothetical protein